MSNWSDYKREDRPQQNKVTGKLRCVITDVEEAVSKSSGKPMIVVTVRPSGTTFKVKNWIVKNEYFNRNMTEFFDTFPEIGEGNFDFITWPGSMGAANFVEDENGYLKIKRWITADRAYDLPEFEGEKPERQTVTSIGNVTDLDEDFDDELPFM